MLTMKKTQQTEELFIFVINLLENKKKAQKYFDFCDYFVNELKECSTLNECYEVLYKHLQSDFYEYLELILSDYNVKTLFIEVIKHNRMYVNLFPFLMLNTHDETIQTKIYNLFKSLSDCNDSGIYIDKDIFDFFNVENKNNLFTIILNAVREIENQYD